MMFVSHFKILAILTKTTNWQMFPNVAFYYLDNRVRYPRCSMPTLNYAHYTKSIALNEVRRFNFVALKRAKSQRCFGVVLMPMDLLRWEHDTLSLYKYTYKFKNMKDFPSLHCDWKMLVLESTRLPVLPCVRKPKCVLYALFFRPSSWGVWTATVSVKVHRLCLCVWLHTREIESQRAAHVAARLSVGPWLACVQCCGCSNVRTVSFHWWCMAVRAFRSVHVSVTLWRTQPGAVVVLYRSCVPSLLAHLPFAFCVPLPSFTHPLPATLICAPRIRHPFDVLSRVFFYFVCHRDNLLPNECIM